MNQGDVFIDRNYISKNSIDDRLYSSFVEHLGNVIYNGIYNPEDPSADENGFRKDVIELVKALNITAIRYPGGNYICSYQWEDTVGPIEKRPKRADLAWMQTEPNTVGLAEFETWVKAVESKLIMSVNLSTRGAVDAANLVEYCNHPGGTYYSDLRKEHGHPEPYNIKTWCVGNEVDGPWNIGRKKAEVYGWDAAEAAKAMRRIDDSIDLVAVGSSGTQLATYPEWDRIVLEAVYEQCDYLSLHRYMGHPEIDIQSSYDSTDIGDYLELAGRLKRNIEDIIAACDYVKGSKRSKKVFYISLDEYNVVDSEIDQKASGNTHQKWEIGPSHGRKGLSMKATLLFGLSMINIMRYSNRIRIACQSILINGDGLVICEKGEPAWVNGSYYIFQHCSLYGKGRLLEQVNIKETYYNTKTLQWVSTMDSVCIYHNDTGEIDVFVVNKVQEELNFSLTLECFGNLEMIEHLSLYSDHLTDYNCVNNPNVLKPKSTQDINISGNIVGCLLKGYSWNVLRIIEK